MAIIKLKRRSSGGAAGAPSTLKTTEPAFNEADETLYLGFGDDGGGNATSIIPIAGKGAFVDKASAQTIAGIKTFGSSPLLPTPALSDNSTKGATTAFVKGQNYITGNQTITVSGDATGSGTTGIELSLAASGVVAGTYTKVTVDAKGRVTVGASLASGDIPTLLHTKISDFDTGVQTNRLDQMAAPTSDISINNVKLTNIADPVNPQDAVNKRTLDAARAGIDFKDSVRAATTANITLSGTQTVDGVALNVDDRVLVKNQTTGSQNGIYLVKSTAWVRATDADTSEEVTSGMFTFVEEGTAHGDTGWVLSTDGVITLDTTALTFTQFSSTASINAGAGLVQNGQDFDIVGAANRIVVNANNIDIAATYVGQASITTLGTIATGTWQGSTVAAAYGGTGLTSYTAGDMIFANGATSLAKLSLGASGTILQSNGTNPVWTDTIDGGTF